MAHGEGELGLGRLCGVADDRLRQERMGPQSWAQARQQAWGGGVLFMQDSGSFLNSRGGVLHKPL